MKSISAREANLRFGHYLLDAMTEPIVIEKHKTPVVAMVSYKEYQRLINLENTYWAEKARAAEEEGYIGEDKSMEFIKAATNVET